MKTTSTPSLKRSGTTIIECVVAATILIVAMTTVSTVAVRVHRLWHDVADQRIAMNELSNQLERLVDLPADAIDEALQELKVSDRTRQSLQEPQIIGRRNRDEDGDHITLELTWKSLHPIASVELTGWRDAAEPTP